MLKSVDGSNLASGSIPFFLLILPVSFDVPAVKMVESSVADGPVQICFDVSGRRPLFSTIPKVTEHPLDNILRDSISDVIGSKRTEGVGIRPEEFPEGIMIPFSDPPC